MLIKQMLGKEGKVYAVLMDMEKTHDRTYWKAMFSVYEVYGVGRNLLSGTKAMCRDANAHVKVVDESFRIHGDVS